ncbi:hypothetical protein ERJ75_001456300 [Trypanosoma vivax]|nr:hypothetical protein ERJ75_001456300 [Trypanosoma vivax]
MRRLPPLVAYTLRQPNLLVMTRLVASPVVLRNVPPAKTSSPLGVTVSKSEVSQAFQVPPELLEQSFRKAEILFTILDLARARFAPLIATVSAEDDLTRIRAEVRASKQPSGTVKLTEVSLAEPLVVSAAREKFQKTAWKNMRELLTFYEEVMLPARLVNELFETLQLTSFHIKDDLKRGLSAFKREHLEKQKAALSVVQERMETCQKFIKNVGATSFDTEIFNDIANILRICGENNPHAHRLSLQVLEDMSFVGIAANELTAKLLHAVVFNDGALDDSALLFSLLEHPERGEVSVSDGPIEQIADNVLQVISRRHHTPVDDGKLLRQTDTHPCLQRSAE